MKPPDDFIKWYEKYDTNTIVKPTIIVIARLPFQFQLGIFLEYLYSKGYIIMVSNLGYKVRRIECNPPEYLIECPDTFGIDDPIMSFYKEAISKCFELINNPF
jgi:hypothetical protein